MSSNIDHLQQLTTVGNIVKHMPSFLFDFDDVVCILFQFLSVFLATSSANVHYICWRHIYHHFSQRLSLLSKLPVLFTHINSNLVINLNKSILCAPKILKLCVLKCMSACSHSLKRSLKNLHLTTSQP